MKLHQIYVVLSNNKSNLLTNLQSKNKAVNNYKNMALKMHLAQSFVFNYLRYHVIPNKIYMNE